MMRSASFFILSVTLHAAALLYPVSFAGRSQAQLIHVTILPMEPEAGGSGRKGSGLHHPSPVRSQSLPRPATIASPKAEGKPNDDLRHQTPSAEVMTNVSDGNVALVSSRANVPAVGDAPVSEAKNQSDAAANRAVDGSGNGFESSSAGAERGNGNSSGPGSAGSGIARTQARYRDTPTPVYPESARSKGREGRVLLRVLVDNEGRSKQVEINSSSGSDALDRAAAETIKRWRFYPAHFGDKAIESWLRIPIEFRLAETKSQ